MDCRRGTERPLIKWICDIWAEKYFPSRSFQTGWPDSPNGFSPNGWLLTLGNYFENYGNSPYFWGYFFPVLSLCINFDKKCLWLHFGQLFQETRLWSPCFRRTACKVWALR
jgi:hypothetical protein